MSDFEHQRPRPNAAYSPVGRAPFSATERFIINTSVAGIEILAKTQGLELITPLLESLRQRHRDQLPRARRFLHLRH